MEFCKVLGGHDRLSPGAKLDRLKTDVVSIRRSLSRLKARARQSAGAEDYRLDRYLDTLDRKQRGLDRALEGVRGDTGGLECLDTRAIEHGVREAWQRVAIAESALDARGV